VSRQRGQELVDNPSQEYWFEDEWQLSGMICEDPGCRVASVADLRISIAENF
jgi:hypothetical protein